MTASMGPRLVSRGRPLGRRWADLDPVRFNGATAGEPWKTWQQSRRKRAILIGFNGATAGEPWKTLAIRSASNWNSRLQWGHGW